MRDVFFAIVVGLIVAYACIDYFTIFGIKQELPSSLQKSYNQSLENYQRMNATISGLISSISKQPEQCGGFDFACMFGQVFGGIKDILFAGLSILQLMLLPLYTILVSVPVAIFESVNYVGSVLGIPSPIIALILSAIGIYAIIEAFKIIWGRR